MLCICAVALVMHGCFQWSQLHSGSNEPWSGYARVVEDPVAKFGGTQVVLNIEGKRYLGLAHAMAGRRLLSSEAGNIVHVEGERVSMPSNSTMRYAPRHIVGTFSVEFVGERISPASPLFRSANKARSIMLRAAQQMPREDAALFMGLVIGDDRAQPRTMISSFRNSGLSHLTAVSGQNVAFVLAVFGVYINRARTWWRLGLTLFLLSWFVVMTPNLHLDLGAPRKRRHRSSRTHSSSCRQRPRHHRLCISPRNPTYRIPAIHLGQGSAGWLCPGCQNDS